jgi:hypothetical protein
MTGTGDLDILHVWQLANQQQGIGEQQLLKRTGCAYNTAQHPIYGLTVLIHLCSD